MAKDMLYQAQTFLIFLLSLYGFNESNARLKVYNRIVRVLIGLFLLSVALPLAYVMKQLAPTQSIDDNTVLLCIKLYFCANLVCLSLCHFRSRDFNALLRLLKRYRVPRNLSRRIRHWNIFLAFFAFPLYVIGICRPTNVAVKSLPDIAADFGFDFINMLLLHCLPLCSLPVLLSIHYINYTVNERMEKVKRCASPLRRARLTTRLILLSTRLNPLTKATNDYGAPLMFMLKATANILTVISIYNALTRLIRNRLETQIAGFVTNVPFLLFFLLYVWYLLVAPADNQTPSLMARVMVENVMSDEQVMSRDLISRIQLLTTRMVQLTHLTHFNFNRNQLTVLGEAVDEEDIFMVFVEIFDNYNSYISGLW